MVKECSFAGGGSGVSARTGNIPFSGCITSVQPRNDQDAEPVIHLAGEHRTAERIVRVPHRDGEVLHRTFVGQYRAMCGKECRPSDTMRVPVECWRLWPATWCEKCSDYSQE